jgi:hypothetical protein
MFAMSPNYDMLLAHWHADDFSVVKAHLRRHGFVIREENDPVNTLLEACGCVTPEMAKGWFRHAGYIR